MIVLLEDSLNLDQYLLLESFLDQTSFHMVRISKNELLLTDSSFNSFISVKQIVEMNLNDQVYVLVKHGLYQHYLKGGNLVCYAH